MAMEKLVIPTLIKEFHDIFDLTIEEETRNSKDFREYRFNVARFLLDMYEEMGKLPYNRKLN